MYNDLDSNAKAVENAGRHIGVGLVLAALISVCGYIGYIEYKAYRAEQALRLEAQKLQIAQEKRRQEQAAKNVMLNRSRVEDRQTRQMHARECRYWKAQRKNLNTREIRAMVTKHCR